MAGKPAVVHHEGLVTPRKRGKTAIWSVRYSVPGPNGKPIQKEPSLGVTNLSAAREHIVLLQALPYSLYCDPALLSIMRKVVPRPRPAEKVSSRSPTVLNLVTVSKPHFQSNRKADEDSPPEKSDGLRMRPRGASAARPTIAFGGVAFMPIYKQIKMGGIREFVSNDTFIEVRNSAMQVGLSNSIKLISGDAIFHAICLPSSPLTNTST